MAAASARRADKGLGRRAAPLVSAAPLARPCGDTSSFVRQTALTQTKHEHWPGVGAKIEHRRMAGAFLPNHPNLSTH